jgi:DNA invertase Pin-like site-specific DNA recombinase
MHEKFIGYVRVSTISQTEGNSLDYQKEAIKNYCNSQNIELTKIYGDEGLSAFRTRPAFQQALNRIRQDNDVTGIVVDDLSRFGRSTIELITTITEIDQLCKKFISLKENINITSKTGKLLLTVLSAIADYERDLIKERMAAGRAWARKNGTKSGLPMHRPEKQIPWNEVKKWRKYNISWTKISEILSNDAKHPDYSISHQTLIKHAKKQGMI